MKRFWKLFSLVSLLLIVDPTVSNASVIPGTKCTKANLQQVYKGKIYTCIKLGSKLYWNNGVKFQIVSATKKPSIPATPDPSPSTKTLPSPSPIITQPGIVIPPGGNLPPGTYPGGSGAQTNTSPSPTPKPSTLLHPNKTKPVINVKLIPGLKSYAVSYDFQTGDEHFDLLILESLTGEFKGEQYIVYTGNLKSVTIQTNNFAPRWVIIRTRDEWSDLNISEVKAGPVIPKNPDVDTSTPPGAP